MPYFEVYSNNSKQLIGMRKEVVLTRENLVECYDDIGSYGYSDGKLCYWFHSWVKNGTTTEVRPVNSSIEGDVDIPSEVIIDGKHYPINKIGMFHDCQKITSIVVPDSVIHIEYGAFEDSPLIESITVSEKNDCFDSRDCCNAIIFTEFDMLVHGCKNTIIPNSVRRIYNYAFGGCSGLTTIDLPESITKIGSDVFYGCDNLSTIKSHITDPSKCEVNGSAFSDITDKCILYVPKGTIEDYRSENYWKEFKMIEEL